MATLNEALNEQNLDQLCDNVPLRKIKADSNEVKDDEETLFGVNESPPLGLTILLSFQYFLLGASAAISIPLMIFGVMCFDDTPDVNDSKTKIMSSFFFLAGVASFLQTTLGVRLPMAQTIAMPFFVVLTTLLSGDKWECPNRIENFTHTNISWESSTSYLYKDNDGSYIDSTEVWQRRMREVQGGIIIVSLLQIVIGASGALAFLMRFIGPLTIGSCIVMVAFSVMRLALKYSSIHWGISMFCAAIIVVSQYLAKFQLPIPKYNMRKRSCSTSRIHIFAMFPFLIAMLGSWLLAHILTVTNVLDESSKARTDRLPDVIANAPWISIPYPFQWGWPTFGASTVITMISALIASVVDSLCDYHACAKVVKSSPIPDHALNRGIIVEGIGSLIHGLVGSGNATTTSASAIAALGVTRVHSRRVIQGMGVCFVGFGIISKFCSFFVSLPLPVIGGQLCFIGGILFSIGIGSAAYADMSNTRNMFALGFSVLMGMLLQTWTATNYKQLDVGKTELNEILRAIVGNGMLVSAVIACVLDNTLPGSMESRGVVKWRQGELGAGEVGRDDSLYDLPFKVEWEWTKRIPFCPMFRRGMEKKPINGL